MKKFTISKKLDISIPKSLIFLTAILGMTSNSFLNLWIMLEINTPMFAMMLIQLKEKALTPLLYFIIQTFPAIILISTLSMTIKFNMSTNFKKMLEISILMTAIMKMGMAPFHNWMILMVKNLKNKSLFLFLSVQKILPLKILSMNQMNKITMSMAILNLITSNIIIKNSNKLWSILAASSMFNLAWILNCLHMSLKTNMIYFSIYISMTYFFMKYTTFHNVKALNLKHKKTNPNLIISTLSLSGLPPMWGFTNKILMIQLMIINSSPLLIILTFLSSSVLMLANYLKTTLHLLMKSLKSMKQTSNFSYWLLLTNLTSPTLLILN